MKLKKIATGLILTITLVFLGMNVSLAVDPKDESTKEKSAQLEKNWEKEIKSSYGSEFRIGKDFGVFVGKDPTHDHGPHRSQSGYRTGVFLRWEF